jgi:class 3 adenylate cyclase
MDHSNIVGDGQQWDDPGAFREERLYVLNADVKNFSQLMFSGNDQPVRRILADAQRRYASECLWSEVAEGDSIQIIDGNVDNLVKAARRIGDELLTAPGNPEMRVAIHFGPVRLQRQQVTQVSVSGGAAFQRVARVEPFVTPRQIWITEEAAKEIRQKRLYELVAAQPHDGIEVDKRGCVNIKKPGSSEPDTWVKLYQLVTGF